MKISILTTITHPDRRQDKWNEALDCYSDFADEIVVVNGGDQSMYVNNKKITLVNLPWPQEWNWIELPRHLNAGLRECTGDWVLKLDIDQFIHEKDFKELRAKLRTCQEKSASLQKMSMTYGKKYYQKGPTQIAFRRLPNIRFGKTFYKKTDLCFPIWVQKYDKVGDYMLPIGNEVNSCCKTGIKFWNYDYFFKTKEFTKKEFWRFSQAYFRYFKSWAFGNTENKAFKVFLSMMKGRHERSPYNYKLKDHPQYIRKAVENLKPEQFGFEAWNLL